MFTNARERYLENEVLGASPQKMRKLMIDGAIRFSHQTIQCWAANDFEGGLESTNRARDIIMELYATLRQGPEMMPIRQIYHFLNTEVTIASFERSPERIKKIIKVLEVEQETWRQVCDNLANPQAEAGPGNFSGSPQHFTAIPEANPIHMGGSFSFEA